ncbi:glucosyltransferase [Halocaridina rubra]|uniref:Dol-P-Glc:Glc(2)Man(9)GlcNAc(2)-PP-Dol alpha-1,2-glucosyltransferase n=1 Tax=Halocaridina rubra TaxID=373956 RepID=A0AAN8XFE3_HALRR
MMSTQQPAFIFPLVIGCFTAVTYVFFVVVYTVQPTEFIDEIYHIPQAQKYCDGRFQEWDPKITTLPGLYLFSIGLNGPVSWVLGRKLCDVFSLRITNLVATAFMLSTIHKLLLYLHGDKVDHWKLMLSAVNLSLLPVMYWFTFLYYTDVLSTLIVLVMILLHLYRAPNAAGAMGVIAIIMRQTNIIWVGFLFVHLAADVLGAKVLKAPVITFTDVKMLMKKLKKIAHTKPHRLVEVLTDVVFDCFSYGAVLLLFLLFVYYNGSIVVGDRKAHEATVHIPQIGYFCLFYLLFSLPYAPSYVRPFVKLCKKNMLLAASVMVTGIMIVHSNTLVHPYLLADNRHYTFYLWNKLYGRFSFVKYVMVPLYMFGAYMVHASIQNRNFIFKILFLGCVIASIVPQKLLEFRYFIIPFLMARLQNVSNSWWHLGIETVYFLLINALTLYIFVGKTFYWEDLPEPQRIIW